MSKFKVGDNVLYIGRDKSNYKNGEIFLVNKIEKNHHGEFLYTASGKPHTYPGCLESELTYPPFTQQDLKVGMYCEFINNIVEVPSKSLCDHWKRQDGLIVIYKKDVQGNLIKIWGRDKEKLYELKCPITGLYLYINQLNEYEWEISGSKFTQEEIDNLPNQDLIKVLIKKENY